MIPAKAVPRSGRNSMDNYTSMGISVRNMEIRQCELYNRMDSSNLADPREDARKLAEADNFVLADIQLQLNLERTEESELTSNLADLREDARELAEADNTVLADDQLRLDV